MFGNQKPTLNPTPANDYLNALIGFTAANRNIKILHKVRNTYILAFLIMRTVYIKVLEPITRLVAN